MVRTHAENSAHKPDLISCRLREAQIIVRTFLIGLFLSLMANPLAHAQFEQSAAAKGIKLERPSTHRIKVGLIVKATGGALKHVVATAPVPDEWPEQKVSVFREEVSETVKSLSYRTIPGGGGVRQMVIEIPQLAAGKEAKALVTFELTRSTIVGPQDTTEFRSPKKPDRPMQINLGAGPYIESRHPKVTAAAKEAIGEGLETDWQKAEAIYEWVRNNVAYKNSELKGAVRALHDKEGDVDELVSVFIAMCRAQKIPARTVFVLGGCYAEFYLEDEAGQGHWFPCQPAGVRSFGSSDDVRPILQKGDNFKNPQNPKERLRYVTEYFNASGRGGQPKVEFVSELVAE